MFGYEFKHIIGAFSKNEYKQNQAITPLKEKKLLLCKKLLNELSILEKRSIIFFQIQWKTNFNAYETQLKPFENIFNHIKSEDLGI